MPDVKSINHLSDSFYASPDLAHQMMTFKRWQETATATEGHIIANGRLYELWAKSHGGGMYQITARLDKP